MKKLLVYISIIIILTISACSILPTLPTTANQTEEATTQSKLSTITLMTHDSFNISKEVMAEFEAANNVKVQLLPAGDAGAMLNQAILSKNNPLADVLFGVDNTFMSRALNNDIFEPYQSPLLADIPDEFKLDPKQRLLPVDYGDVCLNYDKAWFATNEIEPPTNLEALAKPTYKSLTVVENPATSSPGLAFLLATIGHFGEANYLDYWTALRDNDLLVVNGWEEAYWGQFSAASDGNRPIVVSYASSPAAEVFFASDRIAEPPTKVVLADGTCFRQVEFVGILKGTPHRSMAEKLVDFMLSSSFQEDIPIQMFVFPTNQKATLPELFTKFAETANNPAYVSPEDIESGRENWIENWTETTLR